MFQASEYQPVRQDYQSSGPEYRPAQRSEPVRSEIALEVKAVLEEHTRHITELLRIQSQSMSAKRLVPDTKQKPRDTRMLLRRAAL